MIDSDPARGLPPRPRRSVSPTTRATRCRRSRRGARRSSSRCVPACSPSRARDRSGSARSGSRSVGWVLQLLALGKAPLTLVQPVLALGLFLLLALGVRLLGERVGPREWAAVAVIVVAVGLIAYAAPRRNRAQCLAPPASPSRLGCSLAMTVLPFALLRRGAPPVAMLVVAAGAADGLAAFVTKIVSEEISAGRWGIAAVWGAGAGLAVLVGLISESSALQRAAATRVAPVVLVLQIAIPVVLAPLVGGESWAGTPLRRSRARVSRLPCSRSVSSGLASSRRRRRSPRRGARCSRDEREHLRSRARQLAERVVGQPAARRGRARALAPSWLDRLQPRRGRSARRRGC